jgi:curved DNA-binding protein CbpA
VRAGAPVSVRKIGHYELLGLNRNAGPREITAAFRRLAKRWHPDVTIEHSEEATERMQQIAAAYEVLRDPARRTAYDRSLRLDAEQAGPTTRAGDRAEGDPSPTEAWWAPAPGSTTATVVPDPGPPPGFLSAPGWRSFPRTRARR